ncbi:MAG: formyltetrahydrofolate deformylase [Nevskiaceae bacterium]|nr:MAG: formyltetrahydrofolate deformylase [Nevskiaceae bacterium]TBR72778.1 MAG: formyltetrahydrofolate deformylase [Nevskiaceae bacterium]
MDCPDAGTARLLISCPDRPGIVAGVTGLLHARGFNITALDQYSTDPRDGRFFMRLEFQLGSAGEPEALADAFATQVAQGFDMTWQLGYSAQRRRMAILVSRHDHALMELLWRWARGELPVDIPLVISNHPDLRDAVEGFGVRFEHVPVLPDTHEEAEARMLALLERQAEFLVLARYMRILSAAFVARYPLRIINIHHSFLPAFAGADPYRQAHEHGVKLIGATAHFVTPQLDQGPIIEQDTARVSHRFSVAELRTLGRDLERRVLARAVRCYVEDRILVHDNKTIVFD